MYRNGLKRILLDVLKARKILYREDAHAIAVQNHYEPATCERRLREMKEEAGVTALNQDLEPADTRLNEHIVAWTYKLTTVFNKKKRKKNV